jgi:2-dehydro-3-deoxyphosphooctonate aldolase (KDO 8-P synthase)
LGVNYIFKASFDKANRSSGRTFRGPGLQAGLEVLAKIRRELQVPVLTDVHTEEQVRWRRRRSMCCKSPPFCAGKPT